MLTNDTAQKKRVNKGGDDDNGPKTEACETPNFALVNAEYANLNLPTDNSQSNKQPEEGHFLNPFDIF